jgi:monofunctional biosynthetic peptidoglycan transglycosylase
MVAAGWTEAQKRVYVLAAAIGFIIGSIVVVALYRALPPPGTPLMLVRLVEGYGIDKSWRPLDDISPHLIRAAMAGEDARFCRHHGFDWGAIATAWDHYQSGHGRLLGAAPSRCKPRKMSSCGRAATGCEKGSKPGSRR